jgi:hypothetical protein
MKRSGVVAVASLGFSLLAVGCGSSGVSTTPAQHPSTAPTSSTPSTPASPSKPSAQKAGVGDTIDLSDGTSGKNIAVTVVKVVDPDSSSNQFETPPGGDRFESVQFRIVNTGQGAFQDDPLADITAKDAAGQTMQLEFVGSTAAGTQMPSSVNLAPGDTALGFVTFDVPTGDKIAQAQYSLDLGLGTTGEWAIGNGQPPPPASPSSTSPAATSAARTPATTPTPAPAPAPTASPPPAAMTNAPTAASPRSVVEQYFAAISAHDYPLAWALGGKNVHGGSYDSFVQGFATTSSDDVTIVSTSGDTVAIQLDATQTDGNHRFFAGTYTVENGVIVAADVH